MIHRLIYNPNDYVIFVASSGRLKKRIKKLKRNKIFNEVYYIEDKKIVDKFINKAIAEATSNNEIESISKEFANRYEKILPFDIKRISELFILADHGALGLYLLIKKHKYIYIEDARGMYSKWEILDRIIKEKDPGMHTLSLYYNAYGRNDLIVRKYISFNSQLKTCDFKNCVDFDINNLIDLLDDKELKKILKVFKTKKLKTVSQEKNALVLTQRFQTYKLLSR